ncbi:MAG: N-acetylmuramoyl-L-alanine amidase [Gaiellaceae bacterium]
MLVTAPPPAPIVCLDPGHGTPASFAGQLEPIGPGSKELKIKDGGGAPGEAPTVLAIGLKTRTLLVRAGYRVVMTRSGPWFRYGAGGNVDRARFCARKQAALMLRIHADGSSDSGSHGAATYYPSYRRGWTDRIYARSLRAARLVQRALIRATGAEDRGIVPRSDLTGFNWATVPAVLVETGFLTNPHERSLLTGAAYQWKVARGLTAGVASFLGKPPG